jgi:hypothetical protein
MIREQSPNTDPVEKLEQLECHERLHIAYSEERLSKCTLSFYLYQMTKKRRKLLHHMGSAMANDGWNDESTPLPRLAIGLTMIPKGWHVLADKGFTPTSRVFPYMNWVLTPQRIAGRKEAGKRKHRGEIRNDRAKCKLRYTCEVAFARVTLEECLRDVVPYELFRILPHAQAWAHAMNNLAAPLSGPKGSYFEVQK